jgi:hypothetical protein
VDTIDKRPDLSRAILDNGGIVFALKAHAICSRCTNYLDYLDDPESVTLDEFGKAAIQAFRDAGWRICEPNKKALCPLHRHR